MKKEENPWSEGILLICTKCSKSISASELKEEGNAGENLKMFLKKSLKDSGDGKKIRVVTSSCLDVCIDDFQAVTYASTAGTTETMILHPEKEKEELLEFLKSKVRGY
ncbi:(2Fe-2S) ferredoxin domain-containing protein [Bdellovibrio sp. HCB2-146]|uniref:(2Fe-2S) ferredoxin domain-containing protein n=1 Tax=Bdellovibrio sp. HCB2-146 TaxID=3394362 RepID=UPI0039BD3BDE